MNEMLARAMQGVDPDDPGAFLQIFQNLMALVPWWQLLAWQVFFTLVGALLGWWRGRTKAGVIASLVLGPLGWIVPFLPRRVPVRRTPPPLPPRLPGSKKR
jgi:hypothetical protein